MSRTTDQVIDKAQRDQTYEDRETAIKVLRQVAELMHNEKIRSPFSLNSDFDWHDKSEHIFGAIKLIEEYYF